MVPPAHVPPPAAENLMLTSALALATVLAAAPGLETGTQLVYSGSMTGVKDDGNPAVKQFQLVLLAYGAEGGAVEFAWTLEESGRGSWLWLDHFGRWAVAAERRDDGQFGPALLHERADGKSVVPLPGPLFAAPVALEKGATWTEDRLEYKVSGETAARGANDGKPARPACWEIDVRSAYGHKRTLWVAKDSPLLFAVRETVFVGQGLEHKLHLELVEQKSLSPTDTAAATTALQAWLGLKQELAWTPRHLRTELNDEQIATLKAELPALLDSAAAGFWAPIAAAAQKDAQAQKGRAGAVAALRAAAVGQPLGELSLPDLSGKATTHDDLKGKVVVLHFWEYRDTPLEEPYGQVGYLDFLTRRRPGAVVLGVNVDPRLADEETYKSAVAAARRLKTFMNLSYPILQDDGPLLKRLGDPRPASGKLPLFVVIGKDGKIAEYHSGLFEVKANEGLAELDALVGKLLAP
ncbi:MAG: TlpA disulfide reductase family protein [Pirellulaceae bacterium]|nr:TlpA disulfide reductase family protein [Pirellulaceae bacterium]